MAEKDGVSLISTAHPRLPWPQRWLSAIKFWWRPFPRNPESIVTLGWSEEDLARMREKAASSGGLRILKRDG